MKTNRRLTSALKGAILSLFVLVLISVSGCGQGSDRPLVIASYGGDWQAAQKKTMFDPFAQQSGVSVQDVSYSGQLGPITSQVQEGSVKWDVVDVEGNSVVVGQRKEILEPIDYSIVDTSNIISEAIHPYGVGIVSWSWVLAYNTEKFGENPPNSWPDFFNVEEYPGNRGLRSDPRRVLEIALLADGVSPDSLYPLDVERALSKLDQLSSDLQEAGYQIIWWEEYARPATLLGDGQVVMTPSTNGRTATARKEGVPAAFSWNGGIVDLDWWVVPKGTPRREAAMQFIDFASSKEPQAGIAQEIPYGPVNSATFESIPDSTEQRLPTAPQNLEKQIYFNTEWWSENLDRIQSRWNEWYAQRQ
jgi:putative spermidine/putrescine transport system substrate-binding protein